MTDAERPDAQPEPQRPRSPSTEPAPGGPGRPEPASRAVAAGGAGEAKSRLPLILVAAGVALLLVVGINVAVLRGRENPAAARPGGTAPEAAAQGQQPTDAVRGFLEAVAASDGERAVSYLQVPPADQAFLTRPVLAASAKRAPLTGIDVSAAPDEHVSQVTARYKLGKRAVSEEFLAVQTGGSWKITRGTTEIDLSSQRDEELPMLVNGVEVEQDTITLLPGSYAFTTSSPWVSYGDRADLTLTGPSDQLTPQLTPTLTRDAKAAFLRDTKAAVEKCLDQRELAPKGCPNRTRARGNQKIDEESVRWGLTNDPFRKARVALDAQDPSVVQATFHPKYSFEAEGTQDGRRASFDTVFDAFSFRSIGDLSGDRIKVELQSL